MKPPLTYYGGKLRLADRIAALLPGHEHYVDPNGSSISMPDYLEAYVGRILDAAERLRGVSLEARPALDIIDRYGRHADVLLYVDPPYLGQTRNGSNYRHEMPSEADHRELAAALRAARAAVVLSGYPSPLYDELYDGWHRVDIPTGTGQGDGWQARTEVLLANRPIGEPTLLDLLTPGPALALADALTTTTEDR